MRATEIIRDLLDLIDRVEQEQNNKPEIEIEIESPDQASDENHFKQIADLAGQPNLYTDFANQPNEKYASLDSVTKNAGGGVNGPKHPADIKGEHPSLYPGKVYGAK